LLLKIGADFHGLLLAPRIPGFMEAHARMTFLSPSTLSTWKANLWADPSWRPGLAAELPMAACAGDSFTVMRIFKAMRRNSPMEFNPPQVQWRAVFSE
jgi:hypothetical protein